MRACLLVLLLLPIAGYYAVIAFAPWVLALPCWGVPLSIPLALGLIWLGFFITLVYVLHANRRAGAQA